MRIKTVRFHLSLSDLAALYIIIWTITPALGSGGIFRAILLGCACYWVISNFLFLKRHSNELILMVLLLIGYFITQWLSYGINHAVSWTLNMGIYVVVALIGMCYNYENSEKVPLFLNVLLLIIIAVSIISIRTVIVDPYALRRATYAVEDRGHAYGAYSFIYMITQLIPLLFFSIFNKTREELNISRILLCLSLLIGWILVLLSGFTIANAVVAIAVLAFVLLKNFNVKKLLVTLLLLIVVAFTYRYILEAIFTWLGDVVKGNLLYERKTQDLYNQLILGTGAGSSYSGRLDLYKKSWDTLFHNPIIGSAIIRGEDTTGGHSTLVDIMANSGLIVALLYYWLIIRMPIKMIRTMDRGKRWGQLIVVFLFLVLSIGILDTLTYTCAWVWFILLPFLARSLSANEAVLDEGVHL